MQTHRHFSGYFPDLPRLVSLLSHISRKPILCVLPVPVLYFYRPFLCEPAMSNHLRYILKQIRIICNNFRVFIGWPTSFLSGGLCISFVICCFVYAVWWLTPLTVFVHRVARADGFTALRSPWAGKFTVCTLAGSSRLDGDRRRVSTWCVCTARTECWQPSEYSVRIVAQFYIFIAAQINDYLCS